MKAILRDPLKRWNAFCSLLALLYDRYLRGVCLKRMGQTLITFYGIVLGLLLHIQVPAETASRVAAVLTAVAAIVYLIIPKSQQALADNLMDDAATHKEQALQTLDKVRAAVATHHEGTAIAEAVKDAVAAAASTTPSAPAAIPSADTPSGEGESDAASQNQ